MRVYTTILYYVIIIIIIISSLYMYCLARAAGCAYATSEICVYESV